MRAEYPFDSHEMLLEGHRYHYLDEGSGRPLLFVHGNPTWSFAWRRLIRGLRDRYRCLAVDHIGCGLSDKPQDYPYRLARHVENLSRFVRELDLTDITLIGHDWGGCIGVGCVQQNLDRFRSVLLMNTAAFRSQRIPLRIAVCRTPLLGPVGVRGANLFARAALTMAVETPMPPTVREGYLAPYDSWHNRVAVQRFVEDIPLKPSHPSYSALVEIEQRLEDLRSLPIRFVWGMRDWCFTPQFLREWQQRFPDAETVELPAAGHYLFEDEPDAVLEAIKTFCNR